MEPHLKTIKILHLEDERTDALLTERLLRKNGLDFEIKVVDNKQAYTRALKEYKPEVILSDHSLPSFDSGGALRILRSFDPITPFILLSGAVSSETAVEMLKNGANDFILKDRPERLISAINNSLAQAKLEKDKRDSEYQFRKLIESSEDVFCVVTKEGKIKYISPSATTLLDYQKEKGQDYLSEIIKPVRANLILKTLEKCSGKKPNATLKRVFRIQGTKTERWFQAVFTNFLDDSVINGIRVRLREITKEKAAEIKINQSEKKYKSVFDNSLDGILLTSVNGDIHAANPAACKIFQMSEEEICLAGRKGLVDPTDPNLDKAIKERKETGKVLAELRMVRKDGSIFPAELSSSVFSRSDKKILQTTIIIRDITENKKFEEELLKTKERYKSIFQLNPLPAFLIHENTLEILDVNERSCEHYGYSWEEFTKMNLKELRSESEVNKLAEMIEGSRGKDDQLHHAYTKHVKKDGEIIDVDINYHRLIIDDTPCVLEVCRDVTLERENLLHLQETTTKLINAEKIAKLGYWELNPETNTVYCSQQFYKIFGITELTKYPQMDIFIQKTHPEDKEKLEEALKKALQGKAPFNLEVRILTENNEVKWLHGQANLVKNRDKKGFLLKGVIQDITQQKNNTKKILKSEARYKGFIQSQTSYFVRIGLDGNYSFCNDKFIEDFGWLFPEGNPVGHSSLIDVVPYHQEKVKAAGKKCVENPQDNCHVEVHKKLRDGKVKATLWDMIFLADNETGGELQCIGIDISERLEAEKQNKFQAELLKKIGQGIIAADKKGKIIYWNRAAEKMYGWHYNEIVDKTILHLLFPEFDLYEQKFLKHLKEGKVLKEETLATRKNKSTFPIHLTASPLSNENGDFSGIIIISSDLTRLKKSEIKLRGLNRDLKQYTKDLVNANKGLEQFSYIVSHNLRAPAANIIGLADIVKRGGQPKELETRIFNDMIDNVGRLDSVIKDLNEILKVNSKIDTKKELVDIKELIETICFANSHLIDSNEVEINTELEEIRHFKTVKSYLYSIFFNLISNSIKYKRPGIHPIINIRSAKKDKGLSITFQDNGLGMDLSNKKDQIFGLYKRFHDHVDGKGMGLFMVKTQMHIIGGDITVKSVPNEGTKFHLFFKDAINNH